MRPGSRRHVGSARWPRALRHGLRPSCSLRRRTTRAHEPRPRRLPCRIQALSSVAGSIEVALAGSCLRCTLTVPPARGSFTEKSNEPNQVGCIATRPTSGRTSHFAQLPSRQMNTTFPPTTRGREMNVEAVLGDGQDAEEVVQDALWT